MTSISKLPLDQQSQAAGGVTSAIDKFAGHNSQMTDDNNASLKKRVDNGNQSGDEVASASRVSTDFVTQVFN